MRTLVSRLKQLFLSSWHPFGWFALIGFFVYGQTLFFGFSYLDDNVLIIDHINDLRNFSNIVQIFQTDVFRLFGTSTGYYRPLLTLSFMINAAIGGIDPFVYHLTNILIHITVTGLVFYLLLKLRFDRIKTFFLSLLFLVHPVLVQAVAWIPGRNDSLLALFVISSFIFFLKYLEKHKRKDYIWHLVFFFCALLTKESAVALPVLCFFFSVVVKGSGIKSLSSKLYIGWLGSILAWFVLRAMAVHGDSVLIGNGMKAFTENSPALILYLGKVFFPFNLSVFPILPDSQLLYGIFAVVLLIFLLIFTGKKDSKIILFGFVWFFIFMSFALFRTAIKPDVPDFLEHRLYLPLIGMMIVLASLKPFPHLRRRKIFSTFLFVLFLIIFLVINISYAKNFKDRLSFWKNAVAHSPHSSMAHANLGAMYYLDGQTEPAIYEYNKALYLNPGQRMIHNNLGIIFLGQGRWLEAEKEFILEINANPLYVDAYYNLALLRYQQGRRQEARQLITQALEINPDFTDGYQALAADYSQEGNEKQATYYKNELQKRNIPFQKDFFER